MRCGPGILRTSVDENTMTVFDHLSVLLIMEISIGLVASWGAVCLLDWFRD